MSVGYRSFLRAAPGQRLLDTLIDHLDTWTASKGLRLDAAHPGQYQLACGNTVTIVDGELGEGRIYRWVRYHPDAGPREVKRTAFTAFEQPDAGGWVWAQIEALDATSPTPTPLSCMSVPRVIRDLLGAVSFQDGRTDVAAGPQWVTSRHLPDVMDYLADESRRGPVYVASQGAADPERFEHWATEATWHLAGMGSVLLLENSVAPEFNEMVGPRHAVPFGTMRTYLPGVDLDDPEDPPRHRILGIERITSTEPRRLAGMLGLAARVRAAQLRLPPEVLTIDQYLLSRERAAVAVTSPASLRALPSAKTSTESVLLAKLEALENEVRSLRTAMNLQSPDQRRHLTVS